MMKLAELLDFNSTSYLRIWDDKWTAGDELYRALQDEVRHRRTEWAELRQAFDSMSALLNRHIDQMDKHVYDRSEDERNLWLEKRKAWLKNRETVWRLFWCAEQAALHGDRYQNEFDAAELRRSSSPQETLIAGHELWSWGCIRTFLATPGQTYSVTVPIALYDKVGFISRLEVTAYAGGPGVVFRHPADSFNVDVDVSFRGSMEMAWAAAREVLQGKEGDLLRFDGAWRLPLDEPRLADLQGIEGRSAGGSAARAWWHALQNYVEDPYVIVLAQIEQAPPTADHGRRYQLAGVYKIKEKVEAIQEVKGIDTIIVATDQNEREAKSALHPGSLIRVFNLLHSTS